jgi:hypothetical protein
VYTGSNGVNILKPSLFELLDFKHTLAAHAQKHDAVINPDFFCVQFFTPKVRIDKAPVKSLFYPTASKRL